MKIRSAAAFVMSVAASAAFANTARAADEQGTPGLDLARPLSQIAATPAPAPREPEPATEPSGTDFSKGMQDFAVYGRYESTALASRRNLYTVGLQYGYYLFDKLSINPTVNLHYAAWDGEDIVGADFSVYLRYHFWTYERWTAFAELGVGACYFDHRYPIGASNFEFTAGGGLGLGYEIADHTWLIGEIRMDHYSNASIWGSDRHESYNNLGGFVGVMWTF